MDATGQGDASGVWLASTVWMLLEEKYGKENVPSVRKVAQAIREANHGAVLSHGHVHNILNGYAANITDKTREALATFFGISPAALVHTRDPSSWSSADSSPAVSESRPEETLAFRFSTMHPKELAAIEQALRIVNEQRKNQE